MRDLLAVKQQCKPKQWKWKVISWAFSESMLQSWGAGWYLWLQKVRCLTLTSVCTFLMSLWTIRSPARSSYQENAQLKTSSPVFDTSTSAQLSTRKNMTAGRALGSLAVKLTEVLKLSWKTRKHSSLNEIRQSAVVHDTHTPDLPVIRLQKTHFHTL